MLDARAYSNYSHSHHDHHPGPPRSPPPLVLPRRAGFPRAHRLPAGEAPRAWRVAVGRACGHGGVFPGGGNQKKSINIKLPYVVAGMLVEALNRTNAFPVLDQRSYGRQEMKIEYSQAGLTYFPTSL
jgi:hypothetical protein